MITLKEMTNYVRLLDLYEEDLKKHNTLRDLNKWKSLDIGLWYKIGNKYIRDIIKQKIEKQIKLSKIQTKKSNKKQYLFSYK